jgi:hypothetical protein
LLITALTDNGDEENPAKGNPGTGAFSVSHSSARVRVTDRRVFSGLLNIPEIS